MNPAPPVTSTRMAEESMRGRPGAARFAPVDRSGRSGCRLPGAVFRVLSSGCCLWGVVGGCPPTVKPFGGGSPPGLEVQWAVGCRVVSPRRSAEQAQAGAGEAHGAGEGRGRLLQRHSRVVPRHQMGQHQLTDVCPSCVLGRLPRRQVQARREVRAIEKGGLRQQHVSAGRNLDELLRRPRVGRVRQDLARVLDP